MSTASHSIRRRLILFAAIVVIATMGLTGIGLTLLFQRHIERRVGQELDAHLSQIVGGLRFLPDGSVQLARPVSDPRFSAIFGGLYYQVSDDAGSIVLKSRSLWDTVLALPDDALPLGVVHIHHGPGPMGVDVLLHESRVLFTGSGRGQALRVSVGIDSAEITALRTGYARDLIPALALLAATLLAGFAAQIGLGLRPLDTLRQKVAKVRAGQQARLVGEVPNEVMPLVEEVNGLLDLQEQHMIRARDRAADLAHGLKTPLTALVADIDKLRSKGEAAIADDLQEIALRMRRQLDRELARARFLHTRAMPNLAAKPAVDALLRTLAKTPDGQDLRLSNTLPDGLELAVDPVDFMEILGNILENACRFAAQTVTVIQEPGQGGLACIAISDDGPGLSAGQMALAAERGLRLDSTGQGSGLGLAIAKDIAESYSGDIQLRSAMPQGLRVLIFLPKAKDMLKGIGKGIG